MPLLHLPTITSEKSLNRRAEKRRDAAFIDAAFNAPGTRVLALADLRVPIYPTPDRAPPVVRWLSVPEVKALAAPLDFAFLGEDETGAAVFACNVPPYHRGFARAEEALHPLVDLRSLALQSVSHETELLIAAEARALLGWHAHNRCCSRCGGPLHVIEGGWCRTCAGCGQSTWPRTDPAVIMLITRGDRALLGHELRFPDKFYSTLAGYVEPGDDIEHAVRREVKEESGIDVGAVEYVASQPWPFPHSLMIGCWGEALTEAITIDRTELTDARWFDRAELASMLAVTHPEGLFVPPRISMAHTLIRAFVDGVLPRA
ncbi:NAD(+) diphosphatase [Rhodomicrobium udaipurense]|uniref:NAD(+) diphosphatase n=2 Tax=Rhodomicrobium udaipurense TaxID=1202716 RepID=A0A8I1GBQ6_9HYPH|nr:NAD(+) diphosphatase [Rhodomicrobium udaipurense]MBJ7542044.1 NAD(+) diphosphatase [Rhodomicrobium udaipurense]